MFDENPMWDIARLVAEHHQALYAYAYRLTGTSADAEDLTQQTFLVAQQKLGQLREAEHARAWLFTILRNAYLKSRRRQSTVSLDRAKEGMEPLSDRLAAPAEGNDAIDQEKLQQALDDLGDEFKLVVLMFYFEGCSYQEIAERLEVPLGTVMSRLSRAKGRLRQRLFERDDSLTMPERRVMARPKA